jgi:hypothetical protein
MKNWYSISSLARSLEAPYTVIHLPNKDGILIELSTGKTLATTPLEAEKVIRGKVL